MEDDQTKIKIAGRNGLSKAETEALLGRKLDEEELVLYNRTKAVTKLKAKQQEKKPEAEIVKVNPQNDKLAPAISERYTKEQILDVIYRTHGLTAAICSALDCTHNQWNVYLRIRPDIKEAQIEARQGMVDMAEKRLLENLNSKDDLIAQRAAEFILKHIGSQRGWSDLQPAQRINVEKNGKVTIEQIFGITPDEE